MKIFVYGTLKPGEANYSAYCAGKVVEAIPAYTKGQLFDLPLGYPAMTRGEGRVEGVLLTFTDSSVLAALDQLEDYNPQRSSIENEYERQETPVYSLSGEFLDQAWVYVMTPERVRQLKGILLPAGRWTQAREA